MLGFVLAYDTLIKMSISFIEANFTQDTIAIHD
jgi:hypothetical protein